MIGVSRRGSIMLNNMGRIIVSDFGDEVSTTEISQQQINK